MSVNIVISLELRQSRNLFIPLLILIQYQDTAQPYNVGIIINYTMPGWCTPTQSYQ